MLYSEKVMDHFRNPRNLGKMEDADGVGEVGNAKCGDIMKMYIKVKDGIITDVKFNTFGCGSAIATSSMATEMIKGKPIEEALTLSNKAVVEALDGLCRLLTAVFVKSSESWFDGINTAAFTFREEPGRSCRPMPLVFPYSARMPLSVKGGSRLWNSLRALGRPQPGHRAEFDFFWLRPGGGPEFCCVFILADRNRPERFVRLLRASEDFENGAAEAFLEYARAFGLPEALYYSRDEAGDLLNDLAFTCASSLRRVKRLPAVAAALRPLGPVL